MKQIKSPPLGFTEPNFCAVVDPNSPNPKGETRRLTNQIDKPKYQVGDRPYLTEPTRIVLAPDQSCYFDVEYFWHACSFGVEYFWHDPAVIQQKVTAEDIQKILARSTGIKSKQNQRFMLKSFARYFVEITEVRVERLLDITSEGAIREGIEYINTSNGKLFFNYSTGKYVCSDPRQSYLSEIAATHKKQGGWDLVRSNPWVWVYSFTRVETP